MAVVNSYADIAIRRGEDNALIYAEGQKVYYEECKGHLAHPTRGCSGSTAFSLDRDLYTRRIQSFYGLADFTYGGINGSQNLHWQIEQINVQIRSGTLTAHEFDQAHQLLTTLRSTLSRWERAEERILQYLDYASELQMNEAIQGQKVTMLILAFFPMVYSSERDCSLPSIGATGIDLYHADGARGSN